ncbi:RNA degradosome polyphosphate kinase [Apilactobacillus micheneri]|uniref:Polyphosphate kinase n=1 Tax=Apilactobacillus micheneri TaxID=1899430 RepID=A0ABY2YY70_9LACO|nr:RNA degradosome polyphosphate kinase [Apilactobacillus micheneri]TPR26270.1 RNA degradosome polyphosphate kinase [Apilactobacillus micheneri]TPR27024.1 RNA degradosome polyphosphate kinase [Apilactobacillus micheneri]TPR27882.1 RNA degradosome polyphosphate kinase [Apilactobacillus micheneri]TPR31787.1 RNA degradosome polyphosphate kinase [Apilactobacillus micheneri]TPR32191.1 RNA degradosome polyphosphate kinase [Apilactobacillus micheneri]
MSFNKPEYFNSRELSWVDFDKRVLEEANDPTNPLLERLRFLGITQSNLDEFFNIRVASLHKLISVGYEGTDSAGLTAAEQLSGISHKVHELVRNQYSILFNELLPKLSRENINIVKMSQVTQRQRNFLDEYFHQNLYPVLTPLAVDSSRPFPFLANNTLNIGLMITKNDDAKDESFATVQVPDACPRVIKLPGAENDFILLEEVIKYFINELFVGYRAHDMACFRITRDMDVEADEDTSDLMKEIKHDLRKREFGPVMRLEVEAGMSHQILDLLLSEYNIDKEGLYVVDGPIDLNCVNKLIKQVNGHKDLLFEKFTPYMPKVLRNQTMFEAISKNDIFVSHPYDSFQPVMDFISQAAHDKQILAIKMTIYRVSAKSPIIKALKEAAQNGKQVTVLVELKARFDEANNLHWADELERVGCHVIYGLVGLKVHCKLAMVVRQEENGIKRYMHMGTGNYNDVTAKLYTDMGVLTCNQQIGVDATNIFNMLSGFSQPPYFNDLSISPDGIRNYLMHMTDKEIENVKMGKKGLIQMQMNSLSDTQMIEKLYEASAAGVEIHLIVRGICNLRVGIPGVSDNITVHSIVGQLLEHRRFYYFYADGDEKVFLSSADLMNRNLSRRVELMFPVLNDDIRKHLINIYKILWNDNVKARQLHSDDTWTHVRNDKKPLNSQKYMIDNRKKISDNLFKQLFPKKHTNQQKTKFTPMRKPNERKR